MKWIRNILGATLFSALTLGGCGAGLKAPKVPLNYSCEVQIMACSGFSLEVGSEYGTANMIVIRGTSQRPIYCILMTPDGKDLSDSGCSGEADEDWSLGFPNLNLSREDRATYHGYWEILDMESKIERWEDIKESGAFGSLCNRRFENKSCSALE